MKSRNVISEFCAGCDKPFAADFISPETRVHVGSCSIAHAGQTKSYVYHLDCVEKFIEKLPSMGLNQDYAADMAHNILRSEKLYRQQL